jgi:hypothetical protein
MQMEMIESFKLTKSTDGECCTACCYPLSEHFEQGCKGWDERSDAIYLCDRCLEEPEQIDAKLEQRAAHLADKAAWLRSLKGRIKPPSLAAFLAAWAAHYDAVKAADSKWLWLNCIAPAVDLTELEAIRLVNQFVHHERPKINYSDAVMPNGKKFGDCNGDYLRAVGETLQKLAGATTPAIQWGRLAGTWCAMRTQWTTNSLRRDSSTVGRLDRGSFLVAGRLCLSHEESSRLVVALRAEGFSVTATADDFLVRNALPHSRVEAAVTNPPFGSSGRLACQFIAHTLELVPIVAMLLRIDFDSGKTRTNLFRDCQAFAHKIVLLDRIVWFERKGAPGPSENHAWFIWNAQHRGPPTIGYASKSDCDDCRLQEFDRKAA